jgi:hypothetical protein
MQVDYEQVRDWVLALPGGEEVMVEAWGHPTLRVDGRMFASGAPDSPTMTIKCTLAAQAELLAVAPDTYSRAAYVGRFGWVQVELAAADPRELRELVIEAWRATAPKRLIRQYDTGD